MRLIYIYLILLFTSCSKDFLKPKSDKKLVIPTTLKDMQALLDNSQVMNTSMSRLGEVGSDDYYITETNWNNLSNKQDRDAYIWKKEILKGEEYVKDWDDRFIQIYYSNTVLEGLSRLKVGNEVNVHNDIKGSALFFRAKSYFELAQLFCNPYVYGHSNQGLGLPLIKDTQLEKRPVRKTILETYQQIIEDLEHSINLLNDKSDILTRPNKSAALAMLAKVYVSMQDYSAALYYCEKAIKQSDASLIDLNKLANSNFPMKRFNEEVIHHSVILSTPILNSMLLVDTILYNSYENIDLRKTLWFMSGKEGIIYKGSYDGTKSMFSGTTMAELLLIQAECIVRKGEEIEKALVVVNKLLKHRYEEKSFIPINNISTENLLLRIIEERRKELVYRGVRWSDLRRLNLDSLTAITLKRRLNGKVYQLKPNSINYTLPIPDEAILLGLYDQNPRE